jgi:hypothetical protein
LTIVIGIEHDVGKPEHGDERGPLRLSVLRAHQASGIFRA